MKNRFGEIFSVTTFGESHGPGVGGVIDGMPAGIEIDLDRVQHELDRRRPGQSAIVTQRDEKDRVEILSGIFEGKTTGHPVGFLVRNADHHSSDYENMRHVYRPSHADYTYAMKFGLRDHRGGGRSSARETISRVVAGAFARQALERVGITVGAFTSQVGPVVFDCDPSKVDLSLTDSNDVRCPDSGTAARMRDLIMEVKGEGDTVGGVVTGVVRGCPPGLGEPAFDKLHARLAAAMMSINAAKGFDYGLGFAGACRRGSEMADNFVKAPDGSVTVATNHSGGIQGGISNGADIVFRVAFKPVATLLRDVDTITDEGEPTVLRARGRHDPCVVPRAVPVVEAMAAMVILDAWLLNKTVTL